ncbi:MAG: tetratricopeptide repeat protein [Bacteroidia bacterium]
MKRSLPLIILITLGCSLFSQTNPRLDSLLRLYRPGIKDTAQVNILTSLAIEYRNNNPDSAVYFAQLGLDYSQNLKFISGMAACNIAIGTAVTNKGKLDEARVYLKKGLEQARSCGNKTLIARAYANTGNIDMRQSKFVQAMFNYNLALVIRKQLKDIKGMAGLYNNIAMIQCNEGDYLKSLDNYSEALRLYDSQKDQEGISNSYNNMAVVYKYMGRTKDAISNYYKALQISEKTGDKVNIARPHGNMGLIYLAQGANDDALKELNTALKIFTEIDDKVGIAQTYATIGIVLFNQKKYKEARENQLKALELCRQMNDRQGMSMSYDNIASIYEEEGNYTEAMDAFQKARSIKENIEDQSGMTVTMINIGGLYMRQKKYSECISFCKKALAIAQSTGNAENLRDANNYLYRCYSHLNDPENAFKHYQTYIIYRDSLINTENTRKIVQQQMQFDFDKKESIAKAEQGKKDERARQIAQKERMIRNVFVAGFILVLVLAIFIYRSYRDKKKANAIIAAKKQEVEHQKELVEEKQKEILDSINYAKRLQDAILPPDHFVKQHLPESFILYRPKDIVAGDFYWMESFAAEAYASERTEDPLILIAAADCTGHGVPGAMVSVVCSNALNRTVKEFKILEPGRILDEVRKLVIETFEKSESEVRDGMDISLAAINKSKMELTWAGANNPLWIIRNGELTDLRPDKQPIGKMDDAVPFTTHTFQLRKNDSIYLFSDGFADQFGGPKGKKFKYRQMQEILLENASLPMEKQSEILDKRLREWQGKLEQIDDILVIGFRI